MRRRRSRRKPAPPPKPLPPIPGLPVDHITCADWGWICGRCGEAVDLPPLTPGWSVPVWDFLQFHQECGHNDE